MATEHTSFGERFNWMTFKFQMFSMTSFPGKGRSCKWLLIPPKANMRVVLAGEVPNDDAFFWAASG